MPIQVILRDDVPNLGKIGDVVRVKPGYARNFLLPRGLAGGASAVGRQVEARDHDHRGGECEAGEGTGEAGERRVPRRHESDQASRLRARMARDRTAGPMPSRAEFEAREAATLAPYAMRSRD